MLLKSGHSLFVGFAFDTILALKLSLMMCIKLSSLTYHVLGNNNVKWESKRCQKNKKNNRNLEG